MIASDLYAPANGLFAPAALLPDGWACNVAIRFDTDGRIDSIHPETAPGDLPLAPGPVIPGAVNAHSHAFQRALTGRVQRLAGEDDFWTWRERMFRLVGILSPEDVEDLSLRLYRDLLIHGYTSVAEFHYLHRDTGGGAYDVPEELSLRVVSAARDTGIGLTLLPVLYRRSGFDGAPLDGPARRFGLDPDEFAGIMERLASLSISGAFGLGVAPHSLRAVSGDDLAGIEPWLTSGRPVHIHVAEQTGEVEACMRTTGRSPVRRLFELTSPGPTWTLVHATHASPDERADLAAAGASIALCPTTEGDLGDGYFPFADWVSVGGSFAIGSDSQASVSPGEELRLLLYEARLAARRRGVPTPDPRFGHGTSLWRTASMNGARCLGRNAGSIESGRIADLVVLNSTSDLLLGLDPDESTNAFVLSGSAADIASVWVAGRRVVENGRHAADDAIRARWSAAARRLAQALA